MNEPRIYGVDMYDDDGALQVTLYVMALSLGEAKAVAQSRYPHLEPFGAVQLNWPEGHDDREVIGTGGKTMGEFRPKGVGA